jgi:crotonobetaine/carnitine-CoA ligase
MSEANKFILAHLIREQARSQPDLDVATFVTIAPDGSFEEEIRTYQNLWDNGQRIAAGLKTAGMQTGEPFALIMQNHPEFVDAMVGSSIAGAVFVPIDPRTRGQKLSYMLDFVACTGVIIADYAWENLKAVLPDLPNIKWVWVLGEIPNQCPDIPMQSLDEILAAPLPAPELPILATQVSEPMQLLFTSGTTGDPKAIISTYERMAVASSLPALLGLKDKDRPYTGLSLTHANAQMLTLCMCLFAGLRCVISRKFTKSRLWDITRQYECTVFNLLGGMTTAIYSEPTRPDDAENPVRLVISAGMPKVIWDEFETRFGVQAFEFYGAAEGGLTFNPPGIGPKGSVGKPPPNLRVRVVDEQDRNCPPGEPGEIVFQNADGSCPNVRYLKNEAASASKTRNGWLRMGDIGYLDADGWLFFLYRSGGGIRRNGEFINPAFVEKAIAEHPDVDDVFVYGMATAQNAPGEQEVVAAIVPKTKAHFDPDLIFKICAQELEPTQIPGFIQIVREIPKTASEKPQERYLRESFAAHPETVARRA